MGATIKGEKMKLKFRAWDKRFKRFDYGKGDLLLRHNTDDYEEIEQYIGLKDKNGKEIYEGDICTLPYDSAKKLLLEVVYNKMMAGYITRDIKDNSIIRYFNNKTRAFTVVGNIYENKEPLK